MRKTKQHFSTIVLQMTSQLLWLVGLVVGLSGVYLLLKFRQSSLFFSHTYITIPAYLALASAALLLAIGGLGIWASLRESVWLQAVFFYLLVVVLCLVATAAALAHVNTKTVHSDLAPFRNILQRYTGSIQDPESNAVDATQEELHCCGIYDYHDWLTTRWFNHSGGGGVPHSCCNSSHPVCNGSLDLVSLLYPEGCQMKIEEAMRFVLHIIIWSSLAVALVEAVGFVSVARLMRDKNLSEYHLVDREQD
ncbi:hypothetical protein DPEC_G00151730 [Dallia pectoralis]|uniref:Uncharacterized protein n=1 Tax=Dallia pectoralis TaxID=75939 RepID=A0ACC2GJ51_DALPE|nr:hypothetical protein DPEC_G00151730 [Dallia pectoralis]